MTAYNREKYIAEAIESVLASSFRDFELLIVDDCSKDNTVSIAEKYAASDNRIKIFRNEKNLGQFANRNRAASLASAEYIKYLDSDDILEPNGLEVMMTSMKAFPNAAMGFCYTINPDKTGFPFSVSPQQAYRQHFFEGGLLFTGPSGLIYKKKAFDAVGGFEEYGMPSDNHLSLKIAGRYELVAMEPKLFRWREHEEQVFTINKTNFDNILENYRYTGDLINHYSPLSKAENNQLLSNRKKIFWSNIFKLAFQKAKPLTAGRLAVKRFKA